MGRSKTAAWIAGTVVVAFVIVACGWFFAISPLLGSTADMQTQTAFERSRVDQLGIQLAGLAQDFRNIETFREELSALQVEVPAQPSLADLARRLNTLAAESGVVITSLAPTTPIMVTPPVVAVPPAEPPAEGSASEDPVEAAGDAANTVEGDAAAAAGDAAAGGDSASDPTAAAVTGLYAIPIEIVTLGGYEQTLTFISKLQGVEARLVLVNRVMATAQAETGAIGGRPALANGDLEMRLGTFVFVLVSPEVPTDGEEPAEPEPLPVPAGQRNPFVPLS